MVTPGTDSGSPAESQALRAMSIDCGPIWETQPMITSSTAAGSAPVRAISSASTCAARSTGCTDARPPLRRPTGVRTAPTMYASDTTTSTDPSPDGKPTSRLPRSRQIAIAQIGWNSDWRTRSVTWQLRSVLGIDGGELRGMTKITDDTSGLVSIGQLARDAGVSSRTVRYYEELGILPEPRRSAGGTRMYPQEYRGYLAAALALKDLGFRLDEMRALARLAAGRQVSPNQRDAAAALVQDRIEALAMQVIMLRRLHDSVCRPDAAAPVSAVLGAADLSPSRDRRNEAGRGREIPLCLMRDE